MAIGNSLTPGDLEAMPEMGDATSSSAERDGKEDPTSEQLEPLDLVVDLNTMDETGLPWAFLKRADDPSRIVPGGHIVVGAGKVRAVATVVDVVDDVVHVRPLRGPVSQHRHLLTRRQAS